MNNRTRKQDFLDIAFGLFHEKGYEHTTVNDIIDGLQASKGGFYHYFKSKEDVLEAVANQYVEEEIAITLETVECKTNAAAKMSMIINGVMMQKLQYMEGRRLLSGLFEHDGNMKLLRKISENKMKKLYPPYKKVIEQGVAEGDFNTRYPSETTEQVLQMVIWLHSAIVKLISNSGKHPENFDIIRSKLEAYQEAIERLLGAEKGTVGLISIGDAILPGKKNAETEGG